MPVGEDAHKRSGAHLGHDQDVASRDGRQLHQAVERTVVGEVGAPCGPALVEPKPLPARGDALAVVRREEVRRPAERALCWAATVCVR